MPRPEISEETIEKLDGVMNEILRVDAGKISTEEKVEILLTEYVKCRKRQSKGDSGPSDTHSVPAKNVQSSRQVR